MTARNVKVFRTSRQFYGCSRKGCIVRPNAHWISENQASVDARDLTTNSWCYLCSHQVSCTCVFHPGSKFTQDPTYCFLNKTFSIFVQLALDLHRFLLLRFWNYSIAVLTQFLHLCNYHNSGQYPSSCLLFKTQHFEGWILSPSSGGMYSVGPNRQS
jgi:hypothetical protein